MPFMISIYLLPDFIGGQPGRKKGSYTLSNVFTNLSPTSRVRKLVQAY